MTKLHFDNSIPANAPPKTDAPIITMATPKLAPLLRPKTYGPARGLRNKVCIRSPLMASPEPVIIAVIAFGNRYSTIIYRQVSLETSRLKIEAKTSLNGMFTEPKLIFKKPRKITPKKRSKSGKTYFWDCSKAGDLFRCKYLK
jgi:hypothetical protein